MKRMMLESQKAAKLIAAGKIHEPIEVDGVLDLTPYPELQTLPNGLACYELDASGTSLSTLPDDLRVECGITMRNCFQLRQLPSKLKTGTLDLRGCSNLETLPEGLNVWFLDINGCQLLTAFPRRARIDNGGLSMAGCFGIASIPSYVKQLATLDISDCPAIDKLPKKLNVELWIDVAGTGLTKLPPGFESVGVRWRGVEVDERIAFRPEEITVDEINEARNAEVRRVLIERMGIEKFFAEAGARCINRDTDPGGERHLLKLKVPDDEDMVCLSCYCPSTGRHYLLRVPPKTKTCHQAAAWIAGFDDPSKYKPLIET